MGQRRTGSYAAGRQRRARIIDKAAEYFGACGYHRTPLAQIAADVGLTEGGLLYHFPSKKHLLLAVAEHRIETTAAWLSDLGEDADLVTLCEAFVKVTERHLAQPGLIELFVLVSSEAADSSSPAHAMYAARYQQTVDALAGRFALCAERGELPLGTDCAALARQCVAVSDGLQLQWVLAEGAVDLVGGVRDHLRLIMASASSGAASTRDPASAASG